MDKVSGIYAISNMLNTNLYIGSAIDARRREWKHKSELNAEVHGNSHLQRAWKLYGADMFIFFLLEAVVEKTSLLAREQYYIDMLNPEYNLCKTAGSILGLPRSEETKAKIRTTSMGHPVSKEARAKMSKSHTGLVVQLGRLFSAESRAKVSKANKGRPVSAEMRAKLSAAGQGHVVSAETRAKIGAKRRIRVELLRLQRATSED